MMLLSTSNGRAFTLVEVLIVVSIFSVLAGMGLLMTFDSYRTASSQSERDKVVSLLERARSRAMTNYYQTPWGFCYRAPNYILFRATSPCTPGVASNETVPANPESAITFSSSPTVVFAQLSGNTTANTITVTQSSHAPEEIKINNEGRISWF